MDTIRELTSSLRSYLRDRVTNPFYGAYIIAWLILNFRLALVLIGDGTWQQKITYIDTRLFPEPWHWAWFGFGYPLLVAMVFVFASPYISRWVTVFLRQRERDTLARLLVIEGETPLSREQADVLREAVNLQRRLRIEERDQANRQIDELNRQLELAAVGRAELGTTDSHEGDGEHFPLREEDFVGVGASVVAAAVRRGVSRDQARVLHALRNDAVLDLDGLRGSLKLREHHAVKVLTDQLIGLRFIDHAEEGNVLGFKITSAGTQAYEAALKRGFKVSVAA